MPARSGLSATCAAWFLALLAMPGSPGLAQGPPATAPRTWAIPETTLPPKIVSAIRSLFLDGDAPMADPSGGEYREVTIEITSPENGDARPVTTHAWVVTPTNSAPQAVTWNGISYPIQKLGPKVDLDADIKAILDKERAERTAWLKENKDLQYYEAESNTFNEVEHVGYGSFSLQNVVMLLRAGRRDLAEQFWDSIAAGLKVDTRDLVIGDSYEMLSYPYAETLARRALGAFARGQDDAALVNARSCAAVCDICRKIIAERKLGLPKNPQPEAPKAVDYFAGFELINKLASDIQRRAKAPVYDPVILHPEKYRDKTARIAGLIRDLELVGNVPKGSTKALQIAPEVMFKALSAEGDDIVEPLVQCAQRDTRYTRRVAEPRSSLFTDPVPLEPVPVRQMAQEFVERYVGIYFSNFAHSAAGVDITEEEQQAGAIENFLVLWTSLKKLPPSERQYAILRDDTLNADLWLNAAEKISGRDSATRDDPAWIQFREHLRALPKDQPSVHDLLLKRFKDARRSNTRGGESAAENFLANLVFWEGKEAVSTLRVSNPGLQNFNLRAGLGDLAALDEYAAWLKNLGPKDRQSLISSMPGPFALLWAYPDQPSIKAAAEWAFQSPKSPWNPILPNNAAPADAFPYHVQDCLNSPLLGVAPFRKQVLSLLDNQEEVGTVGVDAAGYRKVHVKDGWFDPNRGNFNAGDLKPLVDHPMPLRACDLVAAVVSLAPGAPRFELHWDKARRDTSIALLKDFLQRYGHHIGPSQKTQPLDNSAALTLPILHAAATPEQVAAGDAIFSLTGQGAAQVVKMPLPRRGRWFTNTDTVGDAEFVDSSTGKASIIHSYLNEGTVWQAEDVTIHNKTQRYFGFVWQGGMQRVPAEQMELLPDFKPGPQWTELPRGVDFKLVASGKLDLNTYPPQFHLAVADPLMLTLRLRNRRAVPQSIDPLLVEQDAGKHALKIRAGVTLHVTRLRPGATMESITTPGKCTDVAPMVPIGSFSPAPADSAQPPRQAEAEFDAAKINLRDFFDISQPGVYGVWFTFADGDVSRSPPAVLDTPAISLVIQAAP